MNAAVARLEPQTPREAAGLMREAVRDGFRIGVRGGGTNGPGAFNVDAVLETRGMRRIVEYAPEDQTVSVEAGITFAELQRALALHGQRLIVESAQPERATIGGAIAANVFGPRRLTYGTLKDLILGVGLVRADGVEAHAGGKVVKNVAGFDLSKLMVGSFGTLAVVTAATLRVHPLAERTRAFRVAELAPGEVWSLVIALRKALLEPAAVIAHRDPERARYDVDVLFEGFAVGVAAKVDAFAALAASEGRRFAERDAIEVERTDAAVRAAEPLRFRASTPPAEFAAVDEAVIAPLLAALAGGVAVAYPALGTAFIAGAPRSAAAIAAQLAYSRGHAERHGGSIVVEMLPPQAQTLERWGTPPASFALMQQLKARFDPDGRLNPGSFIGGL